MFNTPAPSQVYLNGEFLFGRDGGRMTPSFHRCPINQYKKIKLAKGVYKLLAGVAANSDKSDIEWVLGIGNAADNLWLSEKECKFF